MRVGKIFTNEAASKGLISKIYKQFMQLRYMSLIKKKLAENLNRNYSKGEIQMAKKHVNICSTSLIVRETQIKTTMSFHLPPEWPSKKKMQKLILERTWRKVNSIILVGMFIQPL